MEDLVDVLDGDRGKNYPKEVDFDVQGHTLFLNASNVTNEGFSFKTNQYITEEKSNSMGNGRLFEDDVIITSRGSLGHIAWYNQMTQCVMPHVRINSGMLILRKRVDISMSYLQQFLRSYKGQSQISFISFGSAQPQLTKKDVQKINITYPANLKEQIKIETYFSALDNLITLHQRKLDNLKLKKKALLQKLFPKNGERYPELRFPGFTDAWEQRKLGDYLIQYTEITTQNNQYPVLTSSRKGLFFQTDYYDGNQIASKNNTGYNIVPYGYFTYRHMSDDDIFHFNINYIVDKGIVSTLYPVFTTKNLNSNYLQLQLNYGTEFREYAVLLKQGGSRTYMYFNKLKDLKLTVSTSIDEQEIIAKFFISFEKLITLHQRKLDHLKLQKKALLQQMFV